MNALLNPAPWQSIPHMLQENCLRYQHHTAVIDGDFTLSYAELFSAVEQCSAAIASHGIQAGDRICLWAPNSWRWIVCAFSCWQVGAVVVPISSRLKALEAGPILSRSGARLLFTVGDCAGIDLAALLATTYGSHHAHPIKEIPSLEKLICFDQGSTFEPCYRFDSFLEASTEPEIINVEAESFGTALGEILFTSGTTGEPKGVMLNQQQVMQAFWDWSDIGGLESSDRFLVIPPFSHGFGINAGILACAMRGMTHVIVDFFNPDTALQLIKKHRISVMSGPPALFASLAQKIKETHEYQSAADTLRVAYVGAAHVPEEMILSMRNALGIDRVINAYGLIEACAVSMTRAQDSIDVISKSVGRPLPNVKIKVVNDNNQPLPENQPGEILVQSYGVMQGYFDAQALTDITITKDQWLHTGDIGTIDAEGNLSIVGRKKDMFICNGFNVYPAEVEDLLIQHPAVCQASVVSIEHAKKGEIGFAFIITEEDKSAEKNFDEAIIIEWARQNMASYKVPIHILAIERFPLNANGKVQKNELQAIAIQHTNREPIGV